MLAAHEDKLTYVMRGHPVNVVLGYAVKMLPRHLEMSTVLAVQVDLVVTVGVFLRVRSDLDA